MSEQLKTILTSAAVVAIAAIVAGGSVYIWENWYWLALGHNPDTLLIRCEQEAGGILINDSCFKKDAVIWPADEAPR